MDNINVERKTSEWSRTRRRKKAWQRVLAGMMAVVVFSTTYALILPAITQEGHAYCGHEAHTHSVEAGCFEEERTLICGLEEAEPGEAHVHTEACFAEQAVLLCTEAELVAHAHSEDCYAEEQRLICENEDEEHEHGEACYVSERVLSCGREETEGHIHGEACWSTENVAICGFEEGQPESEGHAHSDDCYHVTKKLTCTQAEHEHTLACFSNPEADLEDEAIWARSVADVELTGDWAADVLAIAETQLGVGESEKNYIVDENDAKQGYTRYAAWWSAEAPYDPWCAMFVSFCLDYAKVDKELMPQDAGCIHWSDTLKAMGLWREASEYVPRPGDLVFFDFDNDLHADHVGLVKELLTEDEALVTAEDEAQAAVKLRTIEGNNSDKVQQFVYKLDNIILLGYGALPTNPEQDVEQRVAPELTPEEAEAAVEAAAKQVSLSAELENGVVVTLTAPQGNLPYPVEELTLSVTVVEDETAVALVEEGIEDAPELRRETLLFDIKLMHGDEEVQPLGPVNVSFSGINTHGGEAQVFHVDKESETVEEVTAPPAEPAAEENEEQTQPAQNEPAQREEDEERQVEEEDWSESEETGPIGMMTRHFSLYAVTYGYTVDFHLGERTCSLSGGTSILLSNLFASLDVERDVADAVSVVFTDPSLLRVEQQDGDWLLTSLASFDTEEKLIVTFSDGAILEIYVTDPLTGEYISTQSGTSYENELPRPTVRVISEKFKGAYANLEWVGAKPAGYSLSRSGNRWVISATKAFKQLPQKVKVTLPNAAYFTDGRGQRDVVITINNATWDKSLKSHPLIEIRTVEAWVGMTSGINFLGHDWDCPNYDYTVSVSGATNADTMLLKVVDMDSMGTSPVTGVKTWSQLTFQSGFVSKFVHKSNEWTAVVRGGTSANNATGMKLEARKQDGYLSPHAESPWGRMWRSGGIVLVNARAHRYIGHDAGNGGFTVGYGDGVWTPPDPRPPTIKKGAEVSDTLEGFTRPANRYSAEAIGSETSPIQVRPGQYVRYYIQLGTLGQSVTDAWSISNLRDVIPTGLIPLTAAGTYSPTAGFSVNGQTVTWSSLTSKAGVECYVTCRVDMPVDPATFDNVASYNHAMGTGGVTQTVTSNHTYHQVQAANLLVRKSLTNDRYGLPEASLNNTYTFQLLDNLGRPVPNAPYCTAYPPSDSTAGERKLKTDSNGYFSICAFSATEDYGYARFGLMEGQYSVVEQPSPTRYETPSVSVNGQTPVSSYDSGLLTVLIGQTPTPTVAFTNTLSPRMLEVKKLVEDKEIIDPSGNYAYGFEVEVTMDSFGAAGNRVETFTLQDGESKWIYDIPDGAKVRVTETDTGSASQTRWFTGSRNDNSIANWGEEFSIDSLNGNVTVTFVNSDTFNTFKFKKVDDMGEGIAGAFFKLYDLEFRAVNEISPVATGISTSEDWPNVELMPLAGKRINWPGTYYLRETVPPEGYADAAARYNEYGVVYRLELKADGSYDVWRLFQLRKYGQLEREAFVGSYNEHDEFQLVNTRERHKLLLKKTLNAPDFSFEYYGEQLFGRTLKEAPGPISKEITNPVTSSVIADVLAAVRWHGDSADGDYILVEYDGKRYWVDAFFDYDWPDCSCGDWHNNFHFRVEAHGPNNSAASSIAIDGGILQASVCDLWLSPDVTVEIGAPPDHTVTVEELHPELWSPLFALDDGAPTAAQSMTVDMSMNHELQVENRLSTSFEFRKVDETGEVPWSSYNPNSGSFPAHGAVFALYKDEAQQELIAEAETTYEYDTRVVGESTGLKYDECGFVRFMPSGVSRPCVLYMRETVFPVADIKEYSDPRLTDPSADYVLYKVDLPLSGGRTISWVQMDEAGNPIGDYVELENQNAIDNAYRTTTLRISKDLYEHGKLASPPVVNVPNGASLMKWRPSYNNQTNQIVEEIPAGSSVQIMGKARYSPSSNTYATCYYVLFNGQTEGFLREEDLDSAGLQAVKFFEVFVAVEGGETQEYILERDNDYIGYCSVEEISSLVDSLRIAGNEHDSASAEALVGSLGIETEDNANPYCSFYVGVPAGGYVDIHGILAGKWVLAREEKPFVDEYGGTSNDLYQVSYLSDIGSFKHGIVIPKMQSDREALVSNERRYWWERGKINLKKEVSGEMEGPFNFTVSFYDNTGNPVDFDEDYWYPMYADAFDKNGDRVLSFTYNDWDMPGSFIFAIEEGWSVEIGDVPRYTKVVITEAPPDGCTVRYKDGLQTLAEGTDYAFTADFEYDENSGECEDINITCVNSNVPELPSTGGPGTALGSAFGLVTMATALTLGLLRRKRRGEA